jgi:hypothetical protein
MTNIPDPNATPDPIRHYAETEAVRAEIVAGLRALAQFLEDRPELPCPQHADVQHSFMGPLNLRTYEPVQVPDAEVIAFVRGVAAALGVEAKVGEESAIVRYAVAPRTTYTVYAKLGRRE